MTLRCSKLDKRQTQNPKLTTCKSKKNNLMNLQFYFTFETLPKFTTCVAKHQNMKCSLYSLHHKSDTYSITSKMFCISGRVEFIASFIIAENGAFAKLLQNTRFINLKFFSWARSAFAAVITSSWHLFRKCNYGFQTIVALAYIPDIYSIIGNVLLF